MKANRWKTPGILLGVAAAMVVAAVIMVPRLVDLNNYRGLIEKEIQVAVGGNATLGHIRWGIGKEIWIDVDGASISGSTRFPGDLEFARIYAEISTIPLLSGKIVIEELHLEAPDVRLRLRPAPEREDAPAERLPEDVSAPVTAPPSLPIKVAVERVSVKNGKIDVEDAVTLPEHPMTRTFSDVTIEATDLAPGDRIAFRVSLRDGAASGLGKITAQGTFTGLTEALTLKNPELKMTATLPSFDIDAIRPYMTDYEWVRGLRGTTAITLSVESNLGGDFTSHGMIDLSQTAFEDPSGGERLQPKAGTQIAYRIALSKNRLAVQAVDLMWANLSLKSSAVIEDLHADATIRNFALTAELPLQELSHILPWKKLGERAGWVREILSEGGHVTIEEASVPDMRIAALSEKPEKLLSEIQLTGRFSGISVSLLPDLPRIQELEGSIRLTNGIVTLDAMKSRIGTATLPSVSAVVIDLLNAPEIQARINGPLVVGGLTDEKMIHLLSPAGITKMAGTADLDLSLKLALAKPEDFQLAGTIELRAFTLGTAFTPVSFEDIHLEAAVSGDTVDVSDADLTVYVPATGDSPAGKFMVTMSGKAVDLRKRPKLSLRSLKTSPIALPSLASVIPWDAFGKESEQIKRILLSGGSLSIDEMTTPPIDPTSPPMDIASLAERSSAVIRVADINVKRAPGMPGMEGITGRISYTRGVLTAEKMALRYGPIALPDLNVRVEHLFNRPKVEAGLKGHIRIGEPAFPKFKEKLLAYGFKDVTGNADVILTAKYDHAKPDQWTAEGALSVSDLNAESHPEGVRLRRLNADVSFKRDKRLEIDVRKLATQINESPVRLEGRFSQEDAGSFLIDATALAKDLDLAHLVAVSAALRETAPDLKGRVNLDVDLHLSSRNPAASKMTGTITTQDMAFTLSEPSLSVDAVNSRLEFAGDTVYFKSVTARINEQKLGLEGKIIRPLVDPDADLKITASDLDLDKYLPPAGAGKTAGDPKAPGSGQQDKKSDLAESGAKAHKDPKLLLNLNRAVGRIQIEIGKLRYRGNTFDNFSSSADYRRGVLAPVSLKAEYDGNTIRADGSLDFSNHARLAFKAAPNIQGMPVESLAPLLGIEKTAIHGPLFLSGQVQGHTGSTPELLTSLSGTLEAVVGKGTYLETGVTTDILSKILSVASVHSILTGGILRDISGRGIPFDQIKADMTFAGGNLNIRDFQFLSSAMNLEADGSIDLLQRNLHVDVQLEPFEIVDKALGLVPFAGKLGRKFTRCGVSVSGPLDKPRIRLGAVKKITDTLRKEEKESKGLLRRLF